MEIELSIEGKKYIIKELLFEEANFNIVNDKQRSNAEFISLCLVEPKLNIDEILKIPYKIASRLLIECNKLNISDVQYFTNSPMK